MSTTAQQHNSTTAQQHNSTTAQQHNSTTAQQHNSTTAQQHNSTTHRYFYQLLYGLLITICFFTYCKAGNDPVSSSPPPPDEDVHICDVDPPDKDVFLRLDCSSGYRGCKGTEGNEIATITNTIKTDNLPMYTLCRKGSTEYDLTVELKWDVTGSEGSGFGRGLGSSGSTSAYDLHPKVSPPLVNFRYFNARYNSGNTSPKRHSCIVRSDDLSATFYSFKFLDSDGRAIDLLPPQTGEAINRITVEIPAGSQSTTFRLDPHRCPDDSTSDDYDAPPASSSKISVGIKSLDTAEQSVALTSDDTSKGLKVKFSNEELDTSIGGITFKTAIETALETTFADGKEVGSVTVSSGEVSLNMNGNVVETGGTEMASGVLNQLEKIRNVLFNNEIYDVVDKVAGEYGSAE